MLLQKAVFMSKPFKKCSTKFIPFVSAVRACNAKAKEASVFKVSTKEENSQDVSLPISLNTKQLASMLTPWIIILIPGSSCGSNSHFALSCKKHKTSYFCHKELKRHYINRQRYTVKWDNTEHHHISNTLVKSYQDFYAYCTAGGGGWASSLDVYRLCLQSMQRNQFLKHSSGL